MPAPSKTPAWRRYLRFWASDIPGDVDDELQFHVEMRIKEYVARGMSETDARHAVLARLGDLESAKTECVALGHVRERQTRQANLLDGARADIQFALRSLARAPGWTAVALLTIALGVGATTAVFSVADALLVRPIAYPNASRIFLVEREMAMGSGSAWGPIEVAAVREWRRSARSIEAIEGFSPRDLQLETDGEPVLVHAAAIDADFLSFAGARVLIGRDFSPEERTANGPRAIILGEAFWRRQFGAATDAIGKIAHVSGQSYTIVGVAPASLVLPDLQRANTDAWLPLADRNDERLSGVVARVKPNVSSTAVAEELEAIVKRGDVASEFTWTTSTIRLVRAGEAVQFRRALLMLTGAVALLLLVACTNVAHLLLARGTARERELAVRFALGAGRGRLVRQLLTESLVLASIGGALAALVGWVGLRLLAATHPAKLVALSHVTPNRGVLVVASALALLTGVVIGLFAALRTARRGIGESLRVGASGALRGGRRLRSSLVIGEIALSATLLVGALLLVHGVVALQRTDLGFDARGLYGLTFSTRNAQLRSDAQQVDFAARLRARARGIPGVTGVTVAGTIPPNGPFFLGSFETPGHPARPDAPPLSATNSVSPDFFAVMGMRLIAGRTFDAGSLARNEVVINETLARQLWPSGSAIGQRFRVADASTAQQWSTVIGVTRDAVMHGLLGDRNEPTFFTPFGEGGGGRITLIVRVRGGDPGPALKQIAASLRPDASIPVITSVEQSFNESLAEPRFAMTVLATFAVVAVLLATIGLYGVVAYTVAQRTREIGIRMTLGATRGSIARLVVGDGLRLSLIGVVLGLAGAGVASKVIQNALYGVSRGDPLSFGLGAAVLVGVSLLACVIPMWRATAVDPVVAVRVD